MSAIPVCGSGRQRSGTVFENLELTAGMTATCTFFNIRPGSPAIEIVKTGPLTATAGDTLHYTLDVTNIGDVPFPEDAVHVTDETCDDPAGARLQEWRLRRPARSVPMKRGPTRVLTRRVGAVTTACRRRINNTGVVTASPVSDDDSISTIILCPDKPNPPIPVPPEPGRTAAGTRATARPGCATGTAAARRR